MRLNSLTNSLVVIIIFTSVILMIKMNNETSIDTDLVFKINEDHCILFQKDICASDKKYEIINFMNLDLLYKSNSYSFIDSLSLLYDVHIYNVIFPSKNHQTINQEKENITTRIDTSFSMFSKYDINLSRGGLIIIGPERDVLYSSWYPLDYLLIKSTLNK
jgi:hypothetical protein